MMTSKAQSDLKKTLEALRIQCDDVEYAFCTVMSGVELSPEDMLGLFKEAEGVSMIATKRALDDKHLPHEGAFAKLTIGAQTSLEMIGLTAALSTALTKANIPSNIVAAYHHDHIFVPYQMKDKAIKVLEQLNGN